MRLHNRHGVWYSKRGCARGEVRGWLREWVRGVRVCVSVCVCEGAVCLIKGMNVGCHSDY